MLFSLATVKYIIITSFVSLVLSVADMLDAELLYALAVPSIVPDAPVSAIASIIAPALPRLLHDNVSIAFACAEFTTRYDANPHEFPVFGLFITAVATT